MTQKAMELGEGLVAADPSNTLNLAALSECASSWVLPYGRWATSRVLWRPTRPPCDIDRQLEERDPTNQARRRELATTYSNVGEMLRGSRGPDKVRWSHSVSAVAILEPLVAENPDYAEWRYAPCHPQTSSSGTSTRRWVSVARRKRMGPGGRADGAHRPRAWRSLLSRHLRSGAPPPRPGRGGATGCRGLVSKKLEGCGLCRTLSNPWSGCFRVTVGPTPGAGIESVLVSSVENTHHDV